MSYLPNNEVQLLRIQASLLGATDAEISAAQNEIELLKLVVLYTSALVSGSGTAYQPLNPTPNAQTGTTYTAVLADSGILTTLSNGSSITYTVPPNASVAFPVGTSLNIAQLGAGQVTIASGAGVTLDSKSGNLKLTGQYSGACITKIATNTWLVVGDLSA